MRIFVQLLFAALIALQAMAWADTPQSAATQDHSDYFPPRGEWADISALDAGFNPQRLAAAVSLAEASTVLEPRDLGVAIRNSYEDREPDYRVLGPTGERNQGSGVILSGGRMVAQWGDTRQPEMTFSVVKSYLSTIASLAWRDGLIADLDQAVHQLVRGPLFDSAHNQKITWRHLLNQTSDWSGELWDVDDWADRPVGDNPAQWPNRNLHEPGSHYKYNDVRVNLLALSLLEVMREPLPVILREQIMNPIGASPTWRWHGYENSWVTLDGQRIQSVSGGGHFGGGLFISTLDHARFGLLFLRQGRWAGQQIVPKEWLAMAREPTPVKTDYGFMWWLNTDQKRIPAAPASAYFALGYGGNVIYIDEENDLVVVLRWIPEWEDVITAILEARAT